LSESKSKARTCVLEKSNASRCVPSSPRIDAAQVVGARRRAGGAWKPAVVPHEIKSRAALALCMVLQPWDARPREQSCWRGSWVANGSRMGFWAPGVRPSARSRRFLAEDRILSRGFLGFLVRPRRREHDRYASTRLLPEVRYLWTCESPAPRLRVVAARPAVTVLPGSTSTRGRFHASIRSSEGPQTFTRASGREALASALRLAAALDRLASIRSRPPNVANRLADASIVRRTARRSAPD